MIYNLTANGSTTALEWAGKGTLYVDGTFDSASVVLQAARRDSNAFSDLLLPDGNSATLLGDGIINFDLSKGQVRLTVSGAGGSTDITAELVSAKDLR